MEGREDGKEAGRENSRCDRQVERMAGKRREGKGEGKIEKKEREDFSDFLLVVVLPRLCCCIIKVQPKRNAKWSTDKWNTPLSVSSCPAHKQFTFASHR